jgi:hypothetical protein
VQDRLQHYKHLEKKAYDKKSQNLPALKKGDVVRIQEEKRIFEKRNSRGGNQLSMQDHIRLRP